MTYLQFLLVIHVLGAIVGFGSTYAFAFFPQEGERLEPRVRGTFADVSYKITTRFSVPVAFFTQPITGALMIFETGRNRDFFSHTWLWIALTLYLVLIAIFAFVAFPDSRHEYETTREGRIPDPNYRPRATRRCTVRSSACSSPRSRSSWSGNPATEPAHHRLGDAGRLPRCSR